MLGILCAGNRCPKSESGQASPADVACWKITVSFDPDKNMIGSLRDKSPHTSFQSGFPVWWHPGTRIGAAEWLVEAILERAFEVFEGLIKLLGVSLINAQRLAREALEDISLPDFWMIDCEASSAYLPFIAFILSIHPAALALSNTLILTMPSTTSTSGLPSTCPRLTFLPILINPPLPVSM